MLNFLGEFFNELVGKGGLWKGNIFDGGDSPRRRKRPPPVPAGKQKGRGKPRWKAGRHNTGK